jgi:hypothetical protein
MLILDIAAKGKFINDNNLLGFAMYDVTGDTPQNTLVNSISDAIGIVQYCNWITQACYAGVSLEELCTNI